MITKLYLKFYLEICLKYEDPTFEYHGIFFSDENNKLINL